MSVYVTNQKSDSHPLGELICSETLDGSISLHSSHFKEGFHDHEGAMSEAERKFINPADFSRFKAGEHLRILDVCLGLGYNTACALEKTKEMSLNLNWWGLELDRRPIQIALDTTKFRESWSNEVREKLLRIRDSGFWEDSKSQGQILWGDARQRIRSVPKDLTFHLIMLDPFSPSRCPELWSHEFLRALANKLAPNGRLATYCTAAAVRNSLQQTGLQLLSLNPEVISQQKWSAGTLAIRVKKSINDHHENKKWHRLTQMEEEHLLTRAAIPYRDPNGKDTSTTILQRREQEQKVCKLESTSSWQKRWLKK